MKKDLHEVAGLVPCGRDEDGEMEYVGSREVWDRYDALEAEREQRDGEPTMPL